MLDTLWAQWDLIRSLNGPGQVGLFASLVTLLGLAWEAVRRLLFHVLGKRVYNRRYVEELQKDKLRLEADVSALREENEAALQREPAQRLTRILAQPDEGRRAVEARVFADEVLPVVEELALFLARQAHRDDGGACSDHHAASLRYAGVALAVDGRLGTEARQLVGTLALEWLSQRRTVPGRPLRTRYLDQLADALVGHSQEAEQIAKVAQDALDQNRFIVAEALFQRVLSVDNPAGELALRCEGKLAFALHRQGRIGEAMHLFEDILPRQVAFFGPDHAETLGTRHHFAHCQFSAGRYEESRENFREAFERCARASGPSAQQTLDVQYCYANALIGHGALAEAKRLLNENIELREAHLPGDHSRLYQSIYDLACLLERQGDVARSRDLISRIYEEGGRNLGDGSRIVLRAGRELGAHLIDARRYEEARALLESVVTRMQASEEIGPDSEETYMAIRRLANAWVGLGHRDKAIEMLKASRDRQAALPNPTQETVTTAFNLAHQQLDAGDVQVGIEGLRAACQLARSLYGPDYFELLRMYMKLGRALNGVLGEHAEALEVFREAQRLAVAQYGSDSPQALDTELDIMRARYKLHSEMGTLGELGELVQRMSSVLGSDHRLTLSAVAQLGVFVGEMGMFEASRTLLGGTLERQRALFGNDDPDTRFSEENFDILRNVSALEKQGANTCGE